MKLTIPEITCLLDVMKYQRLGYPECWKPKTRAKLVEKGLVKCTGEHSDRGFLFALTDAGEVEAQKIKGTQ